VKPGKNLGWFTALGAALSFDDPLLANFGQKHVPLRFIALPSLFYLPCFFEALLFISLRLFNPLTQPPLIPVAPRSHTSPNHGPDQ
jgi:hypothetical protein